VNEKKESRAAARKPSNAALFFSVKSSPTTFTTSFRIATFRKPGFRALNIPEQKELNAKWPFKVIQGHVFWSQ